MKNSFALITGASQGLGLYLSKELASRGYNLLLVSLPNENLASSSKSIENEFNVIVKFYETDLTVKNNIINLCDWANNYNISILINNAGCGGSKKITEASLDYIEKIIQLNIISTSFITKLIIPNLASNTKSYILNVSSMAAFSPIGYKTVYPASKKFIDYFSLGLREELKEFNISVSVVYPGPMKTNNEVSSRIEKQSGFVKSGVVSLHEMAFQSIEKMLQSKKRVIPGKLNKLSKVILKILPLNTKIKLLSKAIKKEIEV
ncbi:SDR family NAD(P)-dependent oxidoreductase [Tenacibaculum halocynthiae]|uniref:SDR family NAD(P)-dependent oxidoreductase n=1 Tax=Tenacibaculum halocynthiae TaxID=1254437 RepID=UPI0026141596|nr:SDR family NAD(P)-dependent oxidoreductase [uncultured Tenacibaculum sp.]